MVVHMHDHYLAGGCMQHPKRSCPIYRMTIIFYQKMLEIRNGRFIFVSVEYPLCNNLTVVHLYYNYFTAPRGSSRPEILKLYLYNGRELEPGRVVAGW